MDTAVRSNATTARRWKSNLSIAEEHGDGRQDRADEWKRGIGYGPVSAHWKARRAMSARSCCAVEPKVPSGRCRSASAGIARRTAASASGVPVAHRASRIVKEVRVGPPAVRSLMGGHECGEALYHRALVLSGQCQRVERGHDEIGREVAAPRRPLIGETDEAGDVAAHPGPVVVAGAQGSPQRQTAEREPRGGLRAIQPCRWAG